MEINVNTTVQEIVDMTAFKPMRNAFVGAAGDWMNVISGKWTIEEITSKCPTWHYGDILLGIQRLAEVAETGHEYVFDIYSEEEIKDDPALSQVKLIYHPAKHRTFDTYALLFSGGGYGAVCTLVESMPVAARLNELGITAFSLNYRTASKDNAKDGLMPKPVDDVARAIRFIEEHFGISAGSLIIGGFSAGGHLAALWGTRYAEYGLPKPKMLMLDYPLISLENFPEPVKHMFAAGLLGEKWQEEDALTMAVDRFVTEDFPKTYLVTALDDTTVPTKDSQDLEAALVEHNVPHLFERVANGGHGFGLGSVTDAAGWVDRAIGYMEEMA